MKANDSFIQLSFTMNCCQMDQDTVKEFITDRTGNSLFALGSSSPHPQASRLGKC